METARLVDMGKKKKDQETILDQDGILNECASSLATAFEFAVQHRDVEAMLAVSDRWFRIYAEMNGDPNESPAMKLGFIKEEHDSH